mmetsp:Transcript_30896/g.53697  ORF Transcript_30896/g.53697 Transcript_30896/m.53697 type:complete len:120 (-) Transcript_30896:11-370(-)
MDPSTKKQSSPPTAADNRSSVSKAPLAKNDDTITPHYCIVTSSSDAITGSALCYDMTPCLKIMPFNSRSTQCQPLPNCTALSADKEAPRRGTTPTTVSPLLPSYDANLMIGISILRDHH